jgi:hypothetical protein
MKKFLKVLLIVVVSLVVLVYGGIFLGHKVLFVEKTSDVPTLPAAQNAEFTLGVQAHEQPTTMEAYVEVLGEQIKRYNEVAPGLWPDNALINRSAIVESLENGKFWLISPDGSVSGLSKKEAIEITSLNSYSGGFSSFDGGMYLAATLEDLNNYLSWQKYLHLGTYDLFITFSHESFHETEQIKWATSSDVPNASRDEFLGDVDARAKRSLLQKQLLAAIATPGDTGLVLDAVATYKDYKERFPEDYKNALFFDRIEGTAYYYEIISCLYAAYPGTVVDSASLDRALSLLATREDVYVSLGLVTEGYNVGGFAGFLLDRVEPDWKSRLMKEADLSPMEMLLEFYEGEALPPPKVLTQAEIDEVGAEINAPPETNGPVLLFRMLYQLLF